MLDVRRSFRAGQRAVDFFYFLLQIRLARLLKRMGRPTAVFFCVSDDKRCIIKLESQGAALFGGRLHKRREGSELAPPYMRRMIDKVLRQPDVSDLPFYVWGYADKQFFGFDFSERVPTFRLEAALFGVGAKYRENAFSYVVDSRAPYFDGRTATDLETILLETQGGAWEREARTRELIQEIIASKFQKYPEIDGQLAVDVKEQDIVVVGQVEGDAAWLETDTLVKDNLDLVRSARQRFPAARIFFKPHPFSRTKERDIALIQSEGLAEIITARTSFAQVAARRPSIVVNTSGAGLEAALRGCRVYTYGTSYYSHWGFTDDRTQCPRRTNRLSAEDVFYVLLKHYCKYGLRSPLSSLSLEHAVQRMQPQAP
jgi:capsular polysaccharide export protein